jgi:predicted nucleotidyltransferase
VSVLDTALERLGTSLSRLSTEAEALILFGSRAAGMEVPRSDWDILVVGSGLSRISRCLDLIFVPPETFKTSLWRRGELATHVGRWGRTLRGDRAWLETLSDARIGDEAVENKRRRLANQLSASERYWPGLASWAKERRTLKFRRDLQRFELLYSGRVIPPSAVLDRQWSRAADGRLSELIDLADLRGHSNWLMAELGRSSLALLVDPRACSAGVQRLHP